MKFTTIILTLLMVTGCYEIPFIKKDPHNEVLGIFRYKDNVKIKDGFYRGYKGVIQDEHMAFTRCLTKKSNCKYAFYRVYIRTKTEEFTVSIVFHNLELLK